MTDPRAALTRMPHRQSTDRAVLDALLDEAPAGVLSTVVDGMPWSVPMMFARLGDHVVMHGSTGAGALRQVAAGAPVTFSVFVLDGIAVAFSAFESGANYRSAVLRGSLEQWSGSDAERGLDAFVDRVLPGRGAEVPPNTRKELAATVCVALPIVEGQWLYKSRSGESDGPEDGSPTDAWTGVIPFRLVAGDPIPDTWNTSGAPVPQSVKRAVANHPPHVR